jgi:hypothetical protein
MALYQSEDADSDCDDRGLDLATRKRNLIQSAVLRTPAAAVLVLAVADNPP